MRFAGCSIVFAGAVLGDVWADDVGRALELTRVTLPQLELTVPLHEVSRRRDRPRGSSQPPSRPPPRR